MFFLKSGKSVVWKKPNFCRLSLIEFYRNAWNKTNRICRFMYNSSQFKIEYPVC